MLLLLLYIISIFQNESIILDNSDDSDIENYQANISTSLAVGKRRCKNFVVKKNAKGESQLHTACINGSLPVVRHLLEQGHPVNVRDNSGWLPLHEACNHGYLEIVKLLLDKGAAINDRGGIHCGGKILYSIVLKLSYEYLWQILKSEYLSRQ